MAKKQAEKSEQKKITIRQVRSLIGTIPAHRTIVRSLGLRRPNHTIERPDTPAVRGAVAKVPYLVHIVEEVP